MLMFRDIEIEKVTVIKLTYIFSKDVDIEKVLVSNKITNGEKKL